MQEGPAGPRQPDPVRPPKVYRRWLLRLVGSAAVLALIFWLLPADEVWAAMRRVPLGLWLLVLAFFMFGHLAAAYKWWLLTGSGAGVGLRLAIRAHFAGLVTNLCLPGLAGGDVVRAGLVLGGAQDKARIALGSLADRLLDSFGLLLIAGGGAVFLIGKQAFSAAPLISVALVFFAVVAAVVLVAVALPRLPLGRANLGSVALGGLLEKVSGALRGFRAQPGRLALCLGLSILVQSGFVALNVTLAAAIGVSASPAAWYFAWPLAKLIAIVPVSLAGLGVREAGLAALLTPFGAEPAAVVAAGLLWQTVLIAGGLLGGLALLLSSRYGAGSIPVGADRNSAMDRVVRQK